MRRLYCSRDSVSGTWQDPQAFANDQEAERSFCYALACASIPDTFVKDIDLYCIGTFDESVGKVKNFAPKHIANGRCPLYDFYRECIKGNFNTQFGSEEVFDNEISEEEESC